MSRILRQRPVAASGKQALRLRRKVLRALKEAGFKINPHVRPSGFSKTTLRRLQQNARLEQLAKHRVFLEEYSGQAKHYCRDGREVDPASIDLELREVQRDSEDEALFRWWNFIWWSIPYQHPYGRQMRFLLWDKAHDAPFGLLSLQSPVLRMSVRDRWLGIPNGELDLWVNKSLSAQRVGALPPYNDLLGGKMVALAMTSNEVREAYRRKYGGCVSIIEGRELEPDLLFITTTSAFGRSSLYNRLKYNGELVAQCLGYTRGSGTFHVPDSLYEEIIALLAAEGVDVTRGFGHGPSRKLKLVGLGVSRLGLPSFEYHGIKREFYLFPLVRNLRDVISRDEKPDWLDRPFDRLAAYWKHAWALPRAIRTQGWRDFRSREFFYRTKVILRSA